MSAWIVNRTHIDALVLAGVQFSVIDQPTPQTLTELGADLWEENHRSVNDRYDVNARPSEYTTPIAEVVLDPVAVVKLVDCYVYQSCEHPGWDGSRASGYCRRLRAAAMTGLPWERSPGHGEEPYPAGWAYAPWGICELSEAVAVAADVPPSTMDGVGRGRRGGAR
jgi:hypothetical protein